MMTIFLRLLGGTAGPWILGALAALLVGSVSATAIQSLRLDHAKADLESARAALKDPVTRRPWKDLAIERGRDLERCQANAETLKASLDDQTAAVGRWKAEATTRAGEAARAALDARGARAVAESRARELAAIKSASTCPGQQAAIADIVKGLVR